MLQSIQFIALHCIASEGDVSCHEKVGRALRVTTTAVYNDVMASEINTRTSYIMVGVHLTVALLLMTMIVNIIPFLEYLDVKILDLLLG